MRKAAKPVGIIAASIAIAVGITMFFTECGLTLACASNRVEGTKSSVPPKTDAAGGGHVRGSADAPITLVEYGDYECPPCGFYEGIAARLLKEFPDSVKIEFHHFPLAAIHPNAVLAATAAEAAGEQNRYWEMHDLLFVSQSKWKNAKDAEAQFNGLASQIGLDVTQFSQSLESAETRQRVLEDVKRGKTVQIDSTPTFFLNGDRMKPAPANFEEFRERIEQALRK